MKSNDANDNYDFSKEIDSSITGFALGIACVLCAIFICFFNVFHNELINKVSVIILLLFGICGTAVELDRIKELKGISDIILGVVFVIVTIFLIIKFDLIILNIIAFFFLIFGNFGLIQGLIKVAYSMYLQSRNNKKLAILKLITVLTEILALAVAGIQFVNELLKIQ